jgi:protein-tyrosine phosphatase
MSQKDKYVILFVCTGNTCRSPMAEYALRSLLEKERPGKAEVHSAGIAAATDFPATMYAAEAARMWDLDLSQHRSQSLTTGLVEAADLILAMAPEHAEAVVKLVPDARDRTCLLKNFPDEAPYGEEVEDPIGRSLDHYNETFLEIGEYLGKHLPQIVARIDEKLNA